METPGVTGCLRSSAGLCVMLTLLIKGSSGLVCYTTVESLDLGCLLRWDCPRASPNATYTVQTKTQGDPWRDVSWCIWVSSSSCDISQAFSNFELYNMIRLGVHLVPGSTIWIQPRKFDYSDLTFSPPSVSVSLREGALLVMVQFPCAASRRCSAEPCCPVSELIDPWTTVTVCNTLSLPDCQSRTVWTQEAVTYVEFSGLAPGQNYCAVANFSFPTFSMAASSKSAPQCVQTSSKPGERRTEGLLPVLCLGIGLASLLLVPLVSAFVWRQNRAVPIAETPRKTSVSVHDPVFLVPLSLTPLDPCDVHVELANDQISTRSSSGSQSDQDCVLTLGRTCNPLQCHSSSYWDSGGPELEGSLDSSEDKYRTNGD